MLGICCAVMLMGPGIGGGGGSLAEEIATLQTCPDWKQRDRAAHRLRKFDWRCQPEVAWALVEAMLHDCHDGVRKEAAQSLKKLAPCLPEVHEALAYTSRCDPNHCTRLWARWALKALGKRCVGACSICGPAAGPGPIEAVEVVGPGPLGGPLAPLAAPPVAAPPMALPSGIDPTIWKVPTLPRPGTTIVPSVIVPTAPPNVPPGPIAPPLAEPLELPPLEPPASAPDLPAPMPGSASPFNSSPRAEAPEVRPVAERSTPEASPAEPTGSERTQRRPRMRLFRLGRRGD